MLLERNEIISEYCKNGHLTYGIHNIHKAEKIVVFGCGVFGRLIMSELEKKFPNIDKCFADNFINGKYNNYYIWNLEEVVQSDATIVIGSVKYGENIVRQLLDRQVKRERIIIPIEVLDAELKELQRVVRKRFPKKRMHFAIDITEHCNLNCKYCDHFSPIAEKKYVDIQKFEKDLKRLSDLFVKDYEIYMVGLEGGEPLLNNNIVSFIEMVHKYMPNAQINIYTNGILLGKMPFDFWEKCRKYQVIIKVTKYPISFDYDSISRIAEENHVQLEFWSGGDTVKMLDKKPINLNGNSDIDDSFNKCYMGNDSCTMLRNGKIYLCTFAPNIKRFNKYFNQNIEICDKDYVDIYKVNSAKEIMEYLCKPIPCCRYCQPDKWTHGHKWEVSNKVITEWIDKGDADCEV